jgi:transcription-repair coupling factor (superfamily II helicase)
MDTKELIQHFSKLSAIDSTASELQIVGSRIHWSGLIGASRALSSAALCSQVPGHHLFILNDKEEAAYFLNDLESLFLEDNRVLFYPASYRVPYQY